MGSITEKVAKSLNEPLRARLDEAGAEFRSVQYAFWQARVPGAVITFYQSGKLLLQGKAADSWAAELLGGAPTASAAPKDAGGGETTPFANAIAKLPSPAPKTWIGVDETGKGDFFGPLVTAAARVTVDDLPLLAELGATDSKKLNDTTILKRADEIRAAVPIAIVRIGPRRYNELYDSFNNLNKLLAWTHATAAEEILTDYDAELMLSDQFTKKAIIPSYFKGPGKELRFTQRTKAEDDPAVGAASIVARAAFVRAMKRLEREFGVKLPKGAGTPVMAAGRKILEEHGPDIFRDVAKLHFKTLDTVGATAARFRR